MDRKSVTSSNISSIGYSPETQTLEIEFKGGGVYTYHDVCFDADDNIIILRPVTHTPTRAEFRKHEKKWKRDTQYTSSLSEKYLHPSYARIISLGWPAVPMILASLQREPDDWFYALRAITGVDPVRATHAGIMPKMSETWLNWGRQRGLI